MLLFSFALVCWIEDIYAESIRGFHRDTTQTGLKLGFTLFIIREIMFFFAFFWAFFHRRVSPRVELGSKWPPEGILAFDYTRVPLLNTVVLISRGVTVTWAHHSFVWLGRLHSAHCSVYWGRYTDPYSGRGFKEIVFGFIVSVYLGYLFTNYQAVEYAEAFFTIKDGAYGRTFFIATGFHGFHVSVGTWFLYCTYGIALIGVFTFSRHTWIELSIWYWHFVDVVWLFLFVFVYWWGAK